MTRRLALLMSHHRLVLAFSIFTFWTIGQYSTSSRNYSAKHRLLLSAPFLSSSFRASHTGKRAESILSANRQRFLAMLMLQLLRSFQLFFSFLDLSVQASTKTSNTCNLRVFHQILRRNKHSWIFLSK